MAAPSAGAAVGTSQPQQLHRDACAPMAHAHAPPPALVPAEEHGGFLSGLGENIEVEEPSFDDINGTLLFVTMIWVVGKVFSRLGMPTLIGEIAVGVIMGPHLFNVVPMYQVAAPARELRRLTFCAVVGSRIRPRALKACPPAIQALMLYGEVGLMLLVLEAGLDVDIEMLKLIGARGVGVAVSGSVMPLAIASLLCSQVIGLGWKVSCNARVTPRCSTACLTCRAHAWQASLAVGCTLAPTSMGIALNVLKRGKVNATARTVHAPCRLGHGGSVKQRPSACRQSPSPAPSPGPTQA